LIRLLATLSKEGCMALPFRKISQDQLAALTARYPFARRIDSVSWLQSGRPDRAAFAGTVTLAGLWRRDTAQGEPDVAWHLAVDPTGGIWLGRDWNLPAGPDGAFVILLIGDFSAGADPLDGAQREAALRATGLIQGRFDLSGAALRLGWRAAGSVLDGLIEAARRERGGGREPALEPVAASMDGAAADDLALSLLRSAGPVRDAAAVPGGVRSAAVAGEEGVFFPQKITADMKEALLPHVINLTEGRFSTGGLFDTRRDDVDAMFGEHLEQAVAGHGPGNPLRIVIWAHGGLVNERDGLLNAYKHVLWWQRNGVYPIYFVWETGFWQSLGQLLAGGGGGEEAAVLESITDFTDKRLEGIARAAGGPDVWGVMKQNAHAAVDPQTGGAAYAAAKLADFCRRHPGAVELHAAGHSAGAIFHASFIPEALRQGTPSFQSFQGLYLLAPAVRVDLFEERLAPVLGPGRGVERTVIFTMNRVRELDDNCVTIYRKSLLYLIHYALEERPEEPILGLEICLRADAKLKEMFGLGGAGGTAVGEVVWSKSPSTAGPRSRSASTSHGGFNGDPATMDSVLRRVLDDDAIPLSFDQAGTLSPQTALESVPAVAVPPSRALAPPAVERVPRESAPAAAAMAEEDEVPFTVLDAIERATEAAEGIGPQASEPPGPESFLEAVATVDISFGPNAKAADVTAFSRGVLTDVLKAAGLPRVTISSTSRLPADQARVMYVNLERQGIDAQRRLYKEPGRKVIEVYRQGKLAGKDAAAIQAAMTTEIVRLGPTTVSRHASDPKILNVFDVAPSSVANRPAFEAAVRAEPRVSKFLLPPNDPGYHLEIPQPGQAG
jgi:hypothetical protein